MELTDEKTEGRKSHETVPLRIGKNIIFDNSILKWQSNGF
jgi:hypothetical protein